MDDESHHIIENTAAMAIGASRVRKHAIGPEAFGKVYASK
jgi:hypothetical protein